MPERALPERRSIRLPDYDYTLGGAYFVTVCTHKRRPLFGEVRGEEVHHNEYGRLAQRCWEELPDHFARLGPDVFVVMPNHVHGIVFMDGADPARTHGGRAQHAAPLRPRDNVRPGSLGAMVRSFKSAATGRINRLRGTPGAAVWQRNYYEHVIRDDADLEQCREYVVFNAARWERDENNPRRSRREEAVP